MRIQHNIPAMNSYRNYTNNTSALSKNLEKLSSGYKINRAGDDAAGLAISEKMRAQITGLEVAQKNAKDGISLVKTAEGALTEVHDMLNRMYELAEQSANGTYDNEVDRAQLQKEISSLSSEIDRIADSSNFNGIKLLDGSLAGGSSSTSAVAGKLSLSDVVMSQNGAYSLTAATNSESKIELAGPGSSYAADDSITMQLATSDGQIFEATLKFKAGSSGTKGILVDADGNQWGGEFADIAAPSAANVADAFEAMLAGHEDFAALREQFTIDGTSDAFVTLTSKETGANAPTIKVGATTFTTVGGSGLTGKNVAVTPGADAYESLDIDKYLDGIGANGWDKDGDVAAKDAVIDINGQKFAVAKDADSAKALVKEMGKDVNIVMHGVNEAADATALSQLINAKTGLASTTSTGGSGNSKINLKASTTTTTNATGGLTLQIGDTAEDFNKLTVSVKDMHVKAMGIGDIDISKQGGASEAMAKVKSAINYVSDVRGTLGATQNRLDHTINNLSVMQENIQDAESSIRDVDVAKEMMDYTKNNILVQSAQAMLAQANQLPQGVLQLLQ